MLAGLELSSTNLSAQAAASASGVDASPPARIAGLVDAQPTVPMEFSRAWLAKVETVRRHRQDLLAAGRLDGLDPAQAAKLGAALTGELRVLVVPVLYQDSKAPFPESALTERLFGPGHGDTVSYSSYWNEVSGGLLKVTGHVTPWIRLPHDGKYYLPRNEFGWAQFGRMPKFRHDVLRVADGSVDFGQFDNDGPDGIPNSGDDDGFVDFVVFVYALPCSGDTRSGAIWPHRGAMTPFATHSRSVNGSPIKIADYLILPAVDPQTCGPMHVGVLAHETGHALGLPDLYDYDGTSQGIGAWGLMGTGSHSARYSPTHPSAWEKEQLGWVRVDWLRPSDDHIDLAPVETSRRVLRYDLPDGSGDYLLMENRSRIGSDRQSPGVGMLVWKIDPERGELGAWNTNERRPAVGLQQADGRHDLEHGLRADAGDPFPGSSGRHRFEFTDGGALRLSNIALDRGELHADLSLAYSVPTLAAASGVVRMTAMEGTQTIAPAITIRRGGGVQGAWTPRGSSRWLRATQSGDVLLLRADASALPPGEYADTVDLNVEGDDAVAGKVVVDLQVASANGQEVVAADLPWSWGLAARNGRILQASYGWDPLGLRPRPRVLQMRDGQFPSTLARLPSEALYAPVLGRGGEVFVIARADGNNYLYRVESDGRAAVVSSLPGESPAYGSAMLSDGTLLIADWDGHIRRVKSDGTIEPWITMKEHIYQIAADSVGDVFAASFSGDVIRVGHDGVSQLLQTGFTAGRLVAIAADASGEVYAAERGGAGRILRLSTNGTREIVAQIPGAHFYGLTVDGRFLYAADLGHRQLIRIALPSSSSVSPRQTTPTAAP
jgi:M6 family metalloprotease-like protein